MNFIMFSLLKCELLCSFLLLLWYVGWYVGLSDDVALKNIKWKLFFCFVPNSNLYDWSMCRSCAEGSFKLPTIDFEDNKSCWVFIGGYFSACFCLHTFCLPDSVPAKLSGFLCFSGPQDPVIFWSHREDRSRLGGLHHLHLQWHRPGQPQLHVHGGREPRHSQGRCTAALCVHSLML